MAGRIARGEIRLFTFPPPDKSRPVPVLTRDSATAYLSRLTIAPLTSTIRGVPSEVVIGPEDGVKHACAVNLHNVMTVAKNGIGRRVTELGRERMREVCRALAFALGCDD